MAAAAALTLAALMAAMKDRDRIGYAFQVVSPFLWPSTPPTGSRWPHDRPAGSDSGGGDGLTPHEGAVVLWGLWAAAIRCQTAPILLDVGSARAVLLFNLYLLAFFSDGGVSRGMLFSGLEHVPGPHAEALAALLRARCATPEEVAALFEHPGHAAWLASLHCGATPAALGALLCRALHGAAEHIDVALVSATAPTAD